MKDRHLCYSVDDVCAAGESSQRTSRYDCTNIRFCRAHSARTLR